MCGWYVLDTSDKRRLRFLRAPYEEIKIGGYLFVSQPINAHQYKSGIEAEKDACALRETGHESRAISYEEAVLLAVSQ